jgi:hypothetical protein
MEGEQLPNFGPSGVASPTETILFSRTLPY